MPAGRPPEITKQYVIPMPSGPLIAPRDSQLSMDVVLDFEYVSQLDPAVLDKMFRADSDLSRFVLMKAASMAVMVNGYEHEKQDVADFVWETLNDAEGSFFDTLTFAIADTLVFGHFVAEIVWRKTATGKYKIRRFVYIPYQHRTFVLDKKTYDIKGLMLSNGVVIPRNKLFYLNFYPAKGVFGMSEIAPLYPFFLLERSGIYNYGLVLERFGLPWTVAKSVDTQKMLDAVMQMKNIAALAISPDESVELLEPRDPGEVFEKAHDIAIAAYIRKLGIPELLVNVKNRGTYNLGEIQYTAYLEELENTMIKRNDTFVNAIAKLVIDINFPAEGEESKEKRYGKFVITKNPDAEAMQRYASVMQMLYTAGSINDTVRKIIYKRMGIDPGEEGYEGKREKEKGKEKGKEGDADAGSNSAGSNKRGSSNEGGGNEGNDNKAG